MDAQTLLRNWDAGHREPAARWAFILLEQAHSDQDVAGLLDRPVGDRDARLMSLRNELFGPQLRIASRCPNCSIELDAELDGRQLMPQPPASDGVEIECRSSGFVVGFRVPTSRDLAAISDFAEVADAARLLLARCITRAHIDEMPIDTGALPENVVDAITERMAELDPGADVSIRMRCDSCTHEWSLAFDVLSYLWNEIDVWARRALHEVHRLASTYGWSEDAILRLSPARRRAYLALVGA